MNRGLRGVALGVAVALLSSSLTSTAHASSRDVRIAAIQSEIDQAVAAGVPGIVYLVRDGNRIHILTAGVSNTSTGTAIRPDDRFRIASLTKTFVAATILQLVASRQLGLDDKVSKWLPGLIPDDNITVRQLLQHTSGLFDYVQDPDWWAAVNSDLTRRWSPDELLWIGLSHPASFAPGTSWGYSNTGYVALGLLVRAATGESLASLITHQLLRPLYLDNTYVADRPAIRGHHAHGYTYDANGLRDVTQMSPTLAWASGDIVSTVADVAKFYRALFDGQVIPSPLLTEMETFVDTGDGPGYGYGLGLMQNPQPCTTTWGHGGGIFGFSSDAEETTDCSHQSVVYANTDSIPDAAYPHLAKAAELVFCST